MSSSEILMRYTGERKLTISGVGEVEYGDEFVAVSQAMASRLLAVEGFEVVDPARATEEEED